MDCAAQIAQKDSQAQDIRAQLLAAKKEWVPGYTMNGMTREELDQDTSICDLTRSLLLREYAPQRSEAWLLLRQVQVLVTGTSVGPICGDQGQYSTRKNVFEDKCGLRAPFVGNRFTEHGTKYEPEAIALYEKTYNTRVFETGIILHPEHPFIGVSPDGITGNGRLIEVKCPARRAIRDEVPLCYVPQLQLTMAVLDLDSIDFVQYRPPEMGRNMKDEDVVLRKAVFSVTRVARVPDWLESRLFTLVYFQTEVLNHKDQDPEWFQRAKEWREWQLKKEENKALYCSQTPPLVAKLLERKAMREYDPIGAFECAVIERPPRPKKRRFGHSTLYLTPEHKYVISSISPEQLQYYAKDFESLC